MNTDTLKAPLPAHAHESSSYVNDPIMDAAPRLRKHVTIHTQIDRGVTWWIIENKETGANYRLDDEAYKIVARLNGRTTVRRILADLAIEGAIETEHVQSLLNQLQQADLLHHCGPAAKEPGNAASNGSFPWPQKLKNPLGIRIPLWDPDSFLAKTEPRISRCFNRRVISCLGLIVVFGLCVAGSHINTLSAYSAARAEELSSLLLLVLVYPFIKAIHELAHAYSIKRHGGEVHEMGVMLLVFFPIPYVDASASAAFEHKQQRIEVAGAGIAAELALAAIAIIVWANIQHGLMSDIAFSVALIGGLSTLLFNGNPLLRFDGYFAFADWLEIPNLATRARRYCLYLIQKFVLGVTGLLSPAAAPGEARWFVGYFIASSAYRLVIMFGIAIYLIQLLPLFGLLLAMLAIANQLVLPTFRAISYLFNAEELSNHRHRSLTAATAVCAAITVSILFIPVPNWITVPGVVSLPESGIVRASESGFVRELVTDNGAYVVAGQTLAILDNGYLDKEAERLDWKMQELEARRASVVLSAPSEAAQYGESLDATERELNDVKRRIQENKITAPTSGYLQYAMHGDWLGRYLEPGEPLANIINDETRKILTVVPESHIAKIRHPQTIATLRAPASPSASLPAKIDTVTPTGSRNLADAAFGSKHGGSIAVDSREESGKLALEQIFHVELTPAHDNQLRPGSTVQLRFDLQASPIGAQAYAALSRLLMKEVNW